MKKLFVCSMISCLLVNSSFHAKGVVNKGEKVVLESPLLNLIDGKSFGVSAKNFGLILRQRLDLRRRIYGIVQKNGERVGFFELDGQKLTLLDLCEIESKMDSEYNFKMNYLSKNESQYSHEELEKERKEITESYNTKKNALREVLDFAKDDFIEISAKYANGIRGIKEPLLGLIQEFVEKIGLKHCFLLTWGSIAAEDEEDNIRNELKNFKDFTCFCTELVDFLEAMANSCPKGKTLFMEMIKKARQGK